MDADVNTIYSSEFYRIIDFKCKCKQACTSRAEYSKSFNISFIRKGNFIYKVFRNDFDAYTGFAIIDKPGSEHAVEHCHHIPDECTIIDFSDAFYQVIRENHKIKYKSFFSNEDVQSLLVKTDNYVEFLHFQLSEQIKNQNATKIEIDCLVMEILHWFLNRIDNKHTPEVLSPKLKNRHLQTVEAAKNYIFQNYTEDITLSEIADHCNVSLFHFSHIFKEIVQCPPYRFLRDTRLNKAKQLIETADLPMQEVCFRSGFQNIENFNTAFKDRYQYAPSYFKKSKNS